MSDIQLGVAQGVARLILNRRERLNALTEAMMDDLARLCRQIEHARGLHVVILKRACLLHPQLPRLLARKTLKPR